MAMFYFFPNKCWMSRSPICTPLGHHFLGVVELDHKIPELYCYKHSSEIKYSTLFQSGVFFFHHFVAIWWFLFWRSSVICHSIGNWLIANCFMVGGYEHKCVVLRISIGLRSVALAAGEQPESSWVSHKLSSRPLSCSSRRSGHTPHHLGIRFQRLLGEQFSTP
jgi:hypothetical protein